MNEQENHGAPAGGEAIREVRVMSEQGLHARPAARLAKEAQRFMSDIRLKLDGQEADAKSILDILSLAAAMGCDLSIHATGEDAEQAVDSVAQFFENKFGEDA